MGNDEELVVRILVAEGILSADEVHELARAAAQDRQGLLERLHADGRVSGDTLASLRARLNAAPGDPGADLIAEPGDGGEPDEFPVPGWDRYEPIRLLGQGGHGTGVPGPRSPARARGRDQVHAR